MNPLETALSLRADGVACIPVNGNKLPTIKSWRKYMDTLPTEKELHQWFASGGNLALVAGSVVCIDIDEKYQPGLMDAYRKRCGDFGLSELWDRCLLQRTPSGGYHLVFRTDAEIRNSKLAQKDAEQNHETLIETRGKGGYFLIAPSKGYEVLQGDLEWLPTIAADEVSDLLDVARSFSVRAPKEAVQPSKLDDLSPGDDYDQRGDLDGLLTSHGWTKVGDKHWRRPGKDKGISASFGAVPGRFWVWSTSTPFETEHLYRPYAVYAVLEHGGDYSAAARELRRMGYGSAKKVEPVDPRQSLERAIEAKTEEEQQAEEDALLAKLAKVEFWPGPEPEDERCLFKLAGVEIAHVGNHVALVAPVKAGKSAFIGAFLAAATTKSHHHDLLGFEPTNFEERAVIHIDTEQSRNDHHRLLTRSLRRGGTEMPPDYLLSFCMTGWDPEEIVKAVDYLATKATAAFGGVHSIIIDGIADLITSPNDEVEANALERKIRNLAIDHQCCVVNVIHLNPGGRGDTGKSRGHLGSQLERKAETVLFLDKTDEVTMVYSTRTRRAPITRDKAPCFSWCDDAKAHVSVDKKKVRAAVNQKSGRAIPFEVEDLQEILPMYGNKVTRKNVNEIAERCGASVSSVWRRWKTWKEIQEKGTE